MDKACIVRQLDDLSRIVIPVEVRRYVGVKEHDPVEIFSEQNTIILQKYEPGCTFCGEVEKTYNFSNRPVCPKCAAQIAEIFHLPRK